MSSAEPFRDALRDTECFTTIPAKVWQQDWVVHCQPVGNGRKAFQYLAPYIFRVAISNSRLISCENNQVTSRYRDSNTGQPKLLTLEAFEFIHRFLQHILPPGFVKVRYYGFLSPGARSHLTLIRTQLRGEPEQSVTVEETPDNPPMPQATSPVSETLEPVSTQRPETTNAAPADADVSEAAPDMNASSAETESEVEDALAPAEDPTPAPDAKAGAVPRCPACGPLMLRQGRLPPKGRSPP